MNHANSDELGLIEWGVVSRPLAGQARSGDAHLVASFDRGVLVGVIDGAGHGEEATAAARVAVAVLEKRAQDNVISLIERCHAVMAPTRGAVMTLVSLRESEATLTWVGVGNVEGRLIRAQQGFSYPCESVLLRGGLVGYQIPPLQASVLPVSRGDLLILATDGIYPGFESDCGSSNYGRPPQEIAERLMSQHFKGTDDGLVFVARYLGGRR